MKAWRVLYTKANAEYRVLTALRQEQIEVYLPEIAIFDKQGAKKNKPFFPNYLFINIDLENYPLSKLRWTPGLRYMLSFDGQPATVPNRFIALLQRNLAEINVPGAHSFTPGDAVNITEGPFEGMQAIFEGPTTPSERVTVLLTVLGRISRMQIAVSSLKEVSENNVPPLNTGKRPRRTRGKGRRIAR